MRRWYLAALPPVALLGLVAVACGGDDNTDRQRDDAGTATAAGTAMDQAMEHMDEVLAAAEQGDLAAAAEHLELADPFLHEVIEDLEDTDATRAADLEEAVEDAEKDIEEGEEADHIAEVAQEIIDILEGAH